MSNRNERPEELYDPYVRRSKAEEWIKDFNAESRPVELDALLGRPVPPLVAHGGLLTDGRVEEEARHTRYTEDAAGYPVALASQNSQASAPAAQQGMLAPRVQPPWSMLVGSPLTGRDECS